MKLIFGVQPTSYLEGDQVSEVAHYLEKRFKVMETFIGMNEEMIGDQAAKAFVSRLEMKPDQAKKDIGFIAKEFKESIENKKFDGWGPDIPTVSSQKGIRWRKSSPYRGLNRPSFLDTGTYKEAMDVELSDA
jgi:hypothetical protein